MTLCVSGIVRAVHQSSSKLGDTPLARLDLFESLPSGRFGCRASTTNSTAKSRSTVLYICIALSRAGCRALQLYSAPQLYSSTALQLSTLYTLPQAEAPRLGQDWSPCAASVVICGGHFLLPIHVSHSTASRGGTSEPQRVPVHSFSSYPLPCRARPRAGPFGLGPPSRPHLCGACTWQRRLKIPAISSSSRYPLRRGFAAPIQAQGLVC